MTPSDPIDLGSFDDAPPPPRPGGIAVGAAAYVEEHR